MNIVKKDEILMQGLINGNAVVENVMTKPTFTSDYKIDQFAFKGEPVGDITVKVDNKTDNLLNANVSINRRRKRSKPDRNITLLLMEILILILI
jgi:hypothetical protein